MFDDDCLAAVNLCIPREDWSETIEFVDDNEQPIAVAEARAVIKTKDGATTLFDLTTANGRIVIATHLVSLSLSYADLAANTETAGVWDLLIRRADNGKVKRWLGGSVHFIAGQTPSIS